MTVTFQTQADWQNTTYSLNIDTTTVPNHLKADFSSTSARVNSNWIQTSEMPNWSVDANTTVAMGGIGTAYMVHNQVGGGIKGLQSWRSNVTGSGRWDALATIPGASGVWSFIFMAQNVTPGTLFPLTGLPGNTAADYYALQNGYCLRVDSTQGFPTAIRVSLQKVNGNTVYSTPLATTSYPNVGQADHTFTIVRYPTGLFKVFMDGSGTPIISVTDTTYTTGNFLGFASYQSSFVCKNSPGLLKPATSMQTFWFSVATDTSGNPSYWRNRLYIYNAGSPMQLGDFGLQEVTRADTTITTGTVVFPDFVRANQSPTSSPLQYMRLGFNFPSINFASNQDPDVTKVVIGLPLKNSAFIGG